MKIGINAFLWTASFERENLALLPKIKELGFDGVELVRFDFSAFPAADIRKAVEQSGLGCTFCTALTGQQSLGTDDAAVRGQTLEFLKTAIKNAAEAGSKTLSGPFCSAVGLLPGRRRTQDEWARAVEGLRSLGDTLDQYDLTLAVEPLNRFETFFLNTAADVAKLCNEVNHPRVGVLYDTFHANIEEKNQGDAIRSVGKHLRHVHTCENDRGAPGSGPIDWKGVFAALRDVKYDGWLVIESFGPKIKEIAAAACIWRDLASSPEALASDGLKFLRGQI